MHGRHGGLRARRRQVRRRSDLRRMEGRRLHDGHLVAGAPRPGGGLLRRDARSGVAAPDAQPVGSERSEHQGVPVTDIETAEAASSPLNGLSGVDRFIEFASIRCATVDEQDWETLAPARKENYRNLARAMFMTLPPHIGGQLWEYVKTRAPW